METAWSLKPAPQKGSLELLPTAKSSKILLPMGSTAKQNPVGGVGRAGVPRGARAGVEGSLLTHGAGAGSICVVQVSPEHGPCKARGEMGSASGQQQGEQPCFWGAGSTEETGRGEKTGLPCWGESPGQKGAALLVIRLGNVIQADPFPLGRSQVHRACSKGGSLENTAAILFQDPLLVEGTQSWCCWRGERAPAA